MAALAEQFFHTQEDPDQLVVNEEVMDRLLAIHPRTLNQEATADGPICWILLIPTTSALMEEFLAGKIGERELLNRTTPGGSYEAIYLCSALVLPEHRSGGVARRVSVAAIIASSAPSALARASGPIPTCIAWISPDSRTCTPRLPPSIDTD